MEECKRAGAALSRLQIVVYFLLQAVVITGMCVLHMAMGTYAVARPALVISSELRRYV